MSTADTGPKWWQLYLAIPLLIALFMLDAHLKISSHGHQAVQIGIILLVYGLMYMWVNANASALLQVDRSEHRVRTTVVHFPALANEETDPIFEYSDLEIEDSLSHASEVVWQQPARGVKQR